MASGPGPARSSIPIPSAAPSNPSSGGRLTGGELEPVARLVEDRQTRRPRGQRDEELGFNDFLSLATTRNRNAP